MAPAHFFGSRMRRVPWRRLFLLVMLCSLLFSGMQAFAATEHHGQVTFGGLPVPGTTVTATKGNKTVTAITICRASIRLWISTTACGCFKSRCAAL